VCKVFLVDVISLTRANCAQPMSYFDSLLVLLVGLKIILVLVRMCLAALATRHVARPVIIAATSRYCYHQSTIRLRERARLWSHTTVAHTIQDRLVFCPHPFFLSDPWWTLDME
jgi:hypothetical protein